MRHNTRERNTCANITMKKHDLLKGLNPNRIVPKRIRIPEHIAYQMDTYSEQTDMSIGQWLTHVMEDVLPAFEEGASPTVDLRIATLLQLMRERDVARPVNHEVAHKKTREELAQGRPRKPYKGALNSSQPIDEQLKKLSQLTNEEFLHQLSNKQSHVMVPAPNEQRGKQSDDSDGA